MDFKIIVHNSTELSCFWIQASYMRGVKAYNDGDWQLCVNEFETSVKQFFDEEQKCRHICEDKLNWETFDSANPEITVIVTSLY